jgi:hypothetical protein
MDLVIVGSEEAGVGFVVAVSDSVSWSLVVWDGEVGGLAFVASLSVSMDWTKRRFVGVFVEYFSFGNIVTVVGDLDWVDFGGVVARV